MGKFGSEWNEEFDSALLDRCMNRCITLAYKGLLQMRKPLVGALVLDGSGVVIGEGYRSLLDGTTLAIHAERMAINDAGGKARGATLVTTLEPCIPARDSQLLKSCGKLIVETGIVRVIVGCLDDSPTVHHGQGIGYLRERRVQVVRYDGLKSILAGLLG